MRRALLVILLVIIAAGWLGTLVARDPGYVMLAYDGASLQMGLWVFLFLLAVLLVGLYGVLKATGRLRGLVRSFWRWRADKRQAKSRQLTSKGLVLLQAGSHDRAEKFLVSGAGDGESAAANYLAAARAADAQDRLEQREQYLRQALQADSSASTAVAVTRAELQARRHEWRKVLTSLESVPTSPVTLLLRRDALLALEDWQGLTQIMLDLRRQATDPAAQLAFEKRVALARFAAATSDEALKGAFADLPASLAVDPDVVLAYVGRLREGDAKEAVLRKAIKQNWQPELVVAYGDADKSTVARRLKTARDWQKQQADNWALWLCLGQLYEVDGERVQAMQAFEKSLLLQSSRLGHEHLARLLAFEGDHQKSNEHFSQALLARA